MNDNSTSSVEAAVLDCPVYGANSDVLIDQVAFWVEGVVQTAFAVPGLIGNDIGDDSVTDL